MEQQSSQAIQDGIGRVIEDLFLKNDEKVRRIPGVHPIVDQGIDHGIGHGEPIEGQVQVLHVLVGDQFTVNVRVHKVSVVRQPADGEQHHNHNKHPNHLTKSN